MDVIQPGTNKLNYITQQNDFIKSIGKEIKS